MKTNSLLLLGAVAMAFAITGCEGPEADEEVVIELVDADNQPAGDAVCVVVEEGDKGPLPPPGDPRDPPRSDAPASADASLDSADADDASEKDASTWYCTNQSNGCAGIPQVAAMCGQMTYAYVNQYKYLYNVTVCGDPVAHAGCTVTCQKKGSSPQNYGKYWITCNDGYSHTGWW